MVKLLAVLLLAFPLSAQVETISGRMTGKSADKPAAGQAGRLFIASDNNIIFMDDGASWQQIFPHPLAAVASGTATFATTAIASKACSATVSVAAQGVTSTDTIMWSYQADPAAATNAQLNMNFWATANTVNFKRCNSSAASITPSAVVVNWKVIR